MDGVLDQRSTLDPRRKNSGLGQGNVLMQIEFRQIRKTKLTRIEHGLNNTDQYTTDPSGIDRCRIRRTRT